MPIKLPELPYAYNALEPHMDEQTVRIHHDKHHAAYVTNLNAALDKHPEWHGKSLEELMANLKGVPEDIRTAVRNNAGGTWNHNLYWDLLAPNAGGQPGGELLADIKKSFGDFAAFQQKLNAAAIGQFASGWAWLFIDANGKLAIGSTPGHDNPLMAGTANLTGKPLLVVDVWEHAYYLKFQNRRADFVGGFWNMLNWKKVEALYAAARG
jgi:Fe-Mn family superoxide dismutase